MGLRWGFKTESNWYAREFRQDLRVAVHDPLCPWQLAQHLAVPIVKLSEIVKVNARAAYLLTADGAREFSGATVNIGNRRGIVVNDGHSRKRQAADLSHELSHCILHHRPVDGASRMGVRSYDEFAGRRSKLAGACIASFGGGGFMDSATWDVQIRGF